MFIAKICQLFKKENIPFAIVGGYAVAIHGVARGTFDVDLITEITESNLVRIDQALKNIGLQPLLPISPQDLFANLEQYKTERNLVAWNFRHPLRLRESVDIIITEDMRDNEIVEINSEFGKLPTLSIDSLIKMKLRAGREQDHKDVEALAKKRAKEK